MFTRGLSIKDFENLKKEAFQFEIDVLLVKMYYCRTDIDVL